MPTPFITEGKVMNPKQRNARETDHPADGKMKPEAGFAVLSRANPDSYDRSRQGIDPNVYVGPNIAFDEDS
jgi:hypothetical protein